MRRSQDINKTSSGTPSTNPIAGTKKEKLESVYGVPKPKSTVLKFEKPSLVKKPTGPSKIQLGTVNSTKTRQSTLVNAAKSSYGDKYGTSNSSKTTNLKLQKTSSSSLQQGQFTGTKGKNLIPLQNKPTGKIMSGTGKSAKLLSDNNDELEYEDDFEEDYQSDFEEVESTDEEDLGHDDEFLKAKATAAALEREKKIKETDQSNVEPELELQKPETIGYSNSVLEFEELEKRVEQETVGGDEDEDSDDLSEKSDNQIISHSNNITVSGFFSKRNEMDNSRGKGDGLHSSNQIPSSKHQEISIEHNSTLTGQRVGVNLQTHSLTQINNSGQERGIAFVLSSPLKTVTVPKISTSAFDFGRGKREADKEAKLLRGKKLQGMIRLDRVCSDLIHLDPSYEQFMFSFTGTRRVQVAVQTNNERNEESVQTENVDMNNKWTQKPPTWSTTNSCCEIELVRQEALGVGTDNLDDEIEESRHPNDGAELKFNFLTNWENLSKFISRASRKVLYILESEKRLKLPSNKGSSGESEIKMNRGLTILNNLEMGCLNCEGDFVACSNGHSTDTAKKNTSKNIITVWSLKEPSIPMYFLRAWGQVSAIKIYPLGHIIVSGNKDGSISLWDMDELPHYHTQYQDQVIRTPSVTTSCMDPSHFEMIVGLGVLPDSKNTSLVLSLDKGGILKTWVCMRTKEPIEDGDCSQYKSAWSKIHLTIRYVTNLCDSLKETLCITAFCIWVDEESTEFLISTMNGYAARGLLTGDKTVFQKYCESDSTEKDSGVICFDLSLDFNLLAVGCRDKTCRLYEFSKRKRILEVRLESCPSSIKWSKRRSSVFYIAQLDTIFIWDLLVSDMAPWKTICLGIAINGLEIYTTRQKEFTVSMASNELKISSLIGDVRPLSSRDQNRMKSFIALLVT